MPGRQAHGRPLLGPDSRSSRKPKPKSRAIVDALVLAAKQIPKSQKGVRTRDLDPEPERKRPHKDEDGEGDGAGDKNSPKSRNKRQKQAEEKGDSEDNLDLGSDSEGHEWKMGVDGEDEDSEIDSDEAFGEGDEEKFDSFAFRGSSSRIEARQDKARPLAEDDADADEDEGVSLGDDAIDLAQALDDVSEDGEEDSGSNGVSGSDGGESTSDSPATDDEEADDDDDDDDEDNDNDDEAKFDALQSIVTGFAGDESTNPPPNTLPTKQRKIDLQDLGLFGVKDPNIKRSLKLLKKEEKASKPGTSIKLDVPLARRHQARLLRTAASEKANKTLDRWADTVTQNRRADHLIFPLPQSLPNAGLSNTELLPLSRKSAGTELEQTILSILEESGLGAGSKTAAPEWKPDAGGEQAKAVSRSEVTSRLNERRRARELQSREQARAKRIKKIKSKAYRRVHRKEQARTELAVGEQEALEDDEVDSEEEREAQHRRRATERMGARHRESKWAKKAKTTGRAVWDEDFRAGLNEMARRDEELRRRVDGQTRKAEDDDDDETSSDGSQSGDDDGDDDDERRRILRELERSGRVGKNGEPRSQLMQMAFMRRAEAAQKKANDEAVAQIVRDLASDDEEEEGDGDAPEAAEVGRRTYGMPSPKGTSAAKGVTAAARNLRSDSTTIPQERAPRRELALKPDTRPAHQPPSAPGAPGAWSRPQKDKAVGKAARKREGAAATLDVAEAVEFVMAKPKAIAKASKPRRKERERGEAATTRSDASSSDDDGDDDDDKDGARHPLRIRDAELAARAFGGDDEVDADFAREKARIEEYDDDKVVDTTLAGWGSWVGEGVGKRAVKRDSAKPQARR